MEPLACTASEDRQVRGRTDPLASWIALEVSFQGIPIS